MKLPTFVEKVCRTGKHCANCRDLVNGERFRAGAARSGMEMPPEWPVCPKNLQWGWKRQEVPKTRQNANGAPAQPSIADSWAARGPAMWEELHRWALTARMDEVKDWLYAFGRRLGCGDCIHHWIKVTSENPPDTSSNDALFEWTWRMHQKVNERLGKPDMSLSDARARWS